MFCTQCGKSISVDAKFCPSCGTAVNTAENDTKPDNNHHVGKTVDEKAAVNRNFFLGEVPLSVSFWAIGIVGLTCLNYLYHGLFLSDEDEMVYVLGRWSIPLVLANAVVLFGIWRSANRYRGAEVWKVLAKIAIVFYFVVQVSQTELQYAF